MKKSIVSKYILILPVILLLSLCFITSGSAIGNPPVTEYDTVVRVKGLICSICGAGLKKKFKNHFLVKKIYIDIKTQNVYLKHVRDDTLIKSDEIKKMVEDSGYEVSLIKYNKKS